jgi:inorganic pyrophosphatase
MRDLTRLSPLLDADDGTCRVIVETPRGNRAKYDYNPDTDLFELSKILPEGMSFPTDLGFVPSTLCDDGDPLDVMVLSDEPSAVGVLVRARLIGVLQVEQTREGRTVRNDRLLAVPLCSRLYAGARNLDDLEPAFLDNVSRFWINKGRIEGKDIEITGRGGPSAAVDMVRRTTTSREV